MPMKGKRKAIPENTKRELAKFYGSWRCIVDETEHPEYHHLDENPENSVTHNLVPINGTLNSLIVKFVWGQAPEARVSEILPEV